MGLNTKIQWCDATLNFWTGCKKVSPGCKYCYMYRDKERYGQDPENIIKAKSWKQQLRALRLEAETRRRNGKNEPIKIFTCSWSDFFLEEADEWRTEAWEVIKNHPQFVWQILTKRVDRIKECLPQDWGEGWSNVWLGVSVENQQMAEERLDEFVTIPAKVRFISYEPALGGVDFSPWLIGIDWLIVGGESGNETGKWRYRTAELPWLIEVVEQSGFFDVPIYVKQLGTGLAKSLGLKDKNGGDIDEFPDGLRERLFPLSFLDEIIKEENE